LNWKHGVVVNRYILLIKNFHYVMCHYVIKQMQLGDDEENGRS
jgi:hypothetical protein